MTEPRQASPIEQVVLEAPARRARRLMRLQVAAIVVVSTAAVLFGMLCVTLPAEDRALPLAALAILVAAGGVVVGLTDYVHGRSVGSLIATASRLRQSAAERAADLARSNCELRRRDDERSSLFAAMSHELRTPLASIVGFSRALLDGLDGDLNDEQRASVRLVHQSANGLLGIVNRTLDFARLEAGGVTVGSGPVQVWPVVEEAALALHPLAAARCLEIERLIQPNVPAVEADEEALRQVLVNLIANSVKFTEVGRIAIRAEAAGGRVTIAVTDTGPGIPAEAHATIFEPFRQVSPGMVRGGGGTGLGLAICQRLVQLMDGRIWVESEPGSGATFFVSLPAARSRAVDPPLATRDEPAWDVVVVGDPDRTRSFVASLRARGLEATVASGPSSVDDLSSRAPRLVLFDLFMHHADTWRHLAALRSMPAHRDRAVGLVGLADGGGRLVVPAELDVLVDADLEVALAGRVQSLCPDLYRDHAMSEGRVLVVGGESSWRRRLSLILDARGIRTSEAGHVEETIAVARRVPIRGIVADLVLPDPGIAELLSALQAERATRNVPLLLVGPPALSPGQQRDLRREIVRWSREKPVAVSELATSVARSVNGLAPSDFDHAAVGGPAWRAH